MKLNRLFDIFDYQLAHYPKEDALAKKENGKWVTYSTQKIKEEVRAVALGLIDLGIKPGDKVAIISFNRPEWNIVDHAIQQVGAVSVPMYPTISVGDYRYIFNDAEVQAVFVSNEELYERVAEATDQIKGIKKVYTFDRLGKGTYWEEIKSPDHEQYAETLELRKENVQKDDLLTIIYTSGTTGSPKGVMLTHSNLISNVEACHPLLPVDHQCRALSFLPMCHVYERMLTYLYSYAGVSIYYAESMETIGDNLKEVNPHIFTTVPRLLEKIYDKIYAKGLDLTGIKRMLFFWALKLGLRNEVHKNMGFWYNWQLSLANKLIFSKWREAIGGNVRAIVSGSAALQPRLSRVFWAAQIPVLEGYGLTETSPVIAVNRVDPQYTRVGTVGPLIDGVEVKIAEDGEILAKGPNIMKGYYRNPEETAKVLKDGWFYTGDIGEFVEGKYLKITDRKKEMFKTSGGKYVAPQLLENKLKESILIEQVLVIGEGRKFPGALIVPSFENLKEYCKIKDIPYTSDEEMIKHPDILDKFEREVEQSNKSFARYEQIKRFQLMPKPWTIEAGELTPTLKCKRKVILQNYAADVEAVYAV